MHKLLELTGMKERYQQLREIVAACLGVDSAEERRTYIYQACGDDAWLHGEVDSLLRAMGLIDDSFDAGRPEFESTLALPPPTEAAGTEIGPYKICELLGKGGMGMVYVAEQNQTRRKVALKVIKPGMDCGEVIARFDAERQALGLMSHPHIAKVLDGGVTENGRPYFVMELVKGIPITEFCDEQKLTLRERLRMFVNVCQAIQHAHQKGIIHRDLKPNNILVELKVELGVPKVIDFGLAKATDQQLTQHTVYTQLSQVLGTPLYMSPEQARGARLDIDTRSDIYSLGVILYELLTGVHPLDRTKTRNLEFDEIRKMINEVEPARPSQRVKTLDPADISTISECRRTGPRVFYVAMKGELDWIVMKALEKDRNRRYDSASELGQDIERYLNDEPVLACPPSMGYRLQKFVKRHKGLLAALTLILISAILGTAFSFFYAQRATVTLREANQARILAEDNQRKADRANARSRTLLYASDMKLTSDAIANDDVPRAAELLRRHLPQGGEPDLRSFEWHYYQKRIGKPRRMTLTPGGRVDDLALSPDGRCLAAAGASGDVVLYETATWAQKRVLPTSTELVHGLAWSPDNRLIAAACADGTIRVYDAASGNERIIDAHHGRAKDVAFSRDGGHLFSCGEDNLAKSWDLDTGESLLFQGHQRTVERLELSPDGKMLATAGSDGSLILWDAKSSERLQTMQSREGRVVCVAFSPDGRTVVAGNINGFLYRLDIKTQNQQMLAKQLDGVEAVTFFAGGDWLVAADRGGAIRFYATAAEQSSKPNSSPTFGWVAHEGRATSLAVTDDGQSLISGGRDGLVQIWKPDLRGLRWSPDHELDHNDIALGSENELYLAGDGISIWDLDKRELVGKFAASDSPWKLVACSQNGRFLAAARVGRLELFEIPSRRMVAAWDPEPRLEPHRLGISPDGRLIAFAEYTDRDHVTVFDRDTKKARKYPAEQCECVGFSHNGRWLAAGHMDNLRLFDLESKEDVLELKGHTNTLRSFAFRPDDQMIVTASHDRLLKAWRLPDGQEQFSFVAHRDRVTSVMFTPDGRTIATAGRDRLVKLWHADTRQPLGTLNEEHDGLQKILFARDGQRLVGMFEDDSVVVFDASGRPGSQ